MKRLLVIAIGIVSGFSAFSQVSDTSLWSPNGSVNAILLKDSLLYVGGDFDQVSPVTGNFVLLDSATAIVANPFPTISGKINCMVRDSLGYVYVGGLFGRVGSNDCHNLFRLTPQGLFDPNFFPEPDGEIFELAIGWNTLYIGGDFNTIFASTRGKGAAFFLGNDSLTPFDPVSNGPIYAFCVDTLNRVLIVGGDFTVIGQGTIGYVGKLDRDNGHFIGWGNSFWTAIPQVFGPVKAIAVLRDEIFVAGDFNSFASFASPGLGVLDLTSGIVRQIYNANLNGFASDVDVIDEKIYVAGDFTLSGSITRNHLACFDTTLTLLSWNPSANGSVNCLEPSKDSSAIYIAGSFHLLGNDTTYNAGMILLDSLGTVVTWNPKFNAPATVIMPATNSANVWVGGAFFGAGGVLRENLCAININTKAANNWNPQVNLPVTTFCADDSTLFLSGNFTNINGQARNRIASFNLSNSTLTSFNPGVNGMVRTMVSDNVNLFLGGNFSVIGGQNRSNIASVTISSASTTNWNPGCAGTVNKILLDGNHVYVGGFFTQCGGQFRDNMARLNKITGLADWSWTSNTDDGVYDLDLYNGQLYLGGWFQNVEAQSRRFLAAVDTASGNLLPFNPLVENFIRGFVRWNDDLFVSGAFTFVNGNLIRPHLCNYDFGDAMFDGWAPSPDIFPETMQVSQTQLFVGGDFSNIGYYLHPNLCLFNIMWVTGIETEFNTDSSIEIWPNPSSDFVTINFPDPKNAIRTIQVIDVNGRVVKEEQNNLLNSFYTLDIRNLAAGVYMIRVRGEGNEIYSGRIVRQ